jgi:4-hydroxy-3-methylbut-2-enyl diphosphate reductase
MGIRFLSHGPDKYDEIGRNDVVVIPAFGIPAAEIDLLSKKGCIVVDTTCGSVLNVWKNVERYARAGITSVIHGKFEHEETEATFSRTSLFAGAQYLVIRDKTEASLVCNYIENGGNKDEFIARFSRSISSGFNPDVHLARIGLANQTTMLSSESLQIAEMLRVAMNKRYSPEELAERFYSFDTICSATQDRQDAVRNLKKSSMDLMMVIGGYSSSNTNNLAKIAATFTPTFHIQDAASIVDADTIRHKPAGTKEEVVSHGWFPESARTIGITAGASTPNNQIGETIERMLTFRGTMDLATIIGAQ